jgi:hypothetical protein
MLSLSTLVIGQEISDKEKVEKACIGYIEGFYEGDKSKLEVVLKPSLHKFGYWKNKDSGDFGEPIYMTFEGALEYADEVKKKKDFAKVDAPKKVEVLDVMEHIAAAKVTAWWGYDYMLLSKEGGKWMIEEVLWQGPLTK